MLECFRPGVVNDGMILAAVVALGVAAIYLWLKSQHHFFGKRHFVTSLGALFIWLIGCAMELSSTSVTCKVVWAQASWPMIVLLPTAWTFFLFDYCFPGPARRYEMLERLMLWGGPLAAALIVGTNSVHHLFYGPQTRMVTVGNQLSVQYDHGPLFFLLAAYLYVFLGFSVVVTLRGAIQAQERFRLFFVGLFIITAVPGLANLAYVFFHVTVFGFDPTPFAFSAVLTILAWMIVNNRMMDIDSIARDVLFYSAPDPVLVIDVEGKLVGINPSARRLIGRDISGEGIDPDEVSWLGPLARAIVDSGGDPGAELLQVASSYYEVHAARLPKPLDGKNGEMGWVLRLHDFTARRRLQNALTGERDLLSTLMETSLSGILGLDETGVFVFGNAEAGRIIGAQVPGETPLRYDDPAWEFKTPNGNEVTNMVEIFANFLRNPDPVRDQRLSIRRRSDGERRVLSMNATPFAHSGTTARIVLSIADVTDQYRYESRLKDAVARAEAANQAKSRFLANISHEIRTPLNGVLGMAEILDGQMRDPEKKRMVSTIRESGEMLLAMLNDMLDMAKIEAGKMTLEAVPFRVETLAERVDALYQRQAEAKGLAFDVLVGGGAQQPRLGDPLRVQQILQNLISNAIKFTSEGQVRLTVTGLADGALSIEVRDTGIGMTPEQASRIFEEFEQADGSVTRRFGGSGLGMSIVRRLCDMMGGEIAIETSPGLGTTIRLRLPLPLADD